MTKRLAKQREQVHPRVPKTVMEVQLGFYENWDANSYNSLTRHADQLTHVCPTWMSVIALLGSSTVQYGNPRLTSAGS